MLIWYDSNNLNSNYRPFLPLLESAFVCQPLPGLEALTGADLCLATTPISPVDDLAFAISQRYIFVQLKFGNDIFSFDQTRSEQARVQKAKIPLQQAILLFIGRCYKDENEMAFIDGKLAFSPDKPRPYELFEELQFLCFKRGMLFAQIPDESYLPIWINAQFKGDAKIQREGTREVYPARYQAIEETDNIWQRILEVDRMDWRWALVNGLDGFGPVLANNVNDYLHQLGLYPCLYEALRVLTELNEKGKQVHDIASWGKGKCESLRHILGLQSSFDLPKANRPIEPYVQNLAAPFITNSRDGLGEWQRGVKAAVSAFEGAMKAGIGSGKELMAVVQKSASCFDTWTPETWQEWREGLYCDDWLKLNHPNIYADFLKERTK